MEPINADDPIWQQAWRWAMRDDEDLSQSERAQRAAWLLADEAHRAAYEEAQRIQSVASMVRALRDEEDDGASPGDSPSSPRPS